jgi:hypothetical protein
VANTEVACEGHRSARSLSHAGDVCESYEMTPTEPSRDELEAIISSLREEIARLKEEIRRIRRDNNEAPPHYL